MTTQLNADSGASSVASKGLKAGALGLTATVVIGVASTAPGYSLAASVGLVSEEVGLQAPAIMLISFIPMAFIAASYFYMNRADPDCGTTFTWSTIILLAVYVIVTIGAQAAKGPEFLAENADDALGTVGDIVLGGLVGKLLILAVMTSAMASTQTTILPAARSMLSMGSHKAAPSVLADVHRRHLTPAKSTWFFGLVACGWYLLLVAVGGEEQNPYWASIAAVGLMIAFYYGLTGLACVVYYRAYLLRSWRNFVFVGLMPGLGGAILALIFVKSLYDNFQDTESYGTLFGAGSVFTIGVSLLLLGVPLMLWCQRRYPDFFRIRRDPLESIPNPDGTGEPAPVLGTYRKEV